MHKEGANYRQSMKASNLNLLTDQIFILVTFSRAAIINNQIFILLPFQNVLVRKLEH